MVTAGWVFLTLFLCFLSSTLVVSIENRRGQRFILPRFRDWLDQTIDRIVAYIEQKFRYLLRHSIQLSWYYSIHSTLKAAMVLLIKTYDSLEDLFLKNRDRAKVLRAERRKLQATDNHLTAISEHKATTALTATQKKKLRDKKLERG
jgi:hypothetical protein